MVDTMGGMGLPPCHIGTFSFVIDMTDPDERM
jgi:hypothetical protein